MNVINIATGTAYNPLQHIQELGYEIKYEFLPGDIRGLTSFDERVVTIDSRLFMYEARSTAAHEAAHCERGPTQSGETVVAHGLRLQADEAEERVCEEIAATRCIILPELLEQAPNCRSFHELKLNLVADWEHVLLWLEMISDHERALVAEATAHLKLKVSPFLSPEEARVEAERIQALLPR